MALKYKGKTLVRSGNIIYYGEPDQKYIAMIQIQSQAKYEDMELPNKLSIQLIATDTTLPPQERIVKKSEKADLYSALDIAAIWLERGLSND